MFDKLSERQNKSLSPPVTNFALNSNKECNFLYASQFHVILFRKVVIAKEEGGQNTLT